MEVLTEPALVSNEQLLLSPACGEADRRWASFFLREGDCAIKWFSVMTPDSRQVLIANGVVKDKPIIGERTIFITDGPLTGFICCDLSDADQLKLMFDHQKGRTFPGKLGIVLKFKDYSRYGIRLLAIRPIRCVSPIGLEEFDAVAIRKLTGRSIYDWARQGQFWFPQMFAAILKSRHVRLDEDIFFYNVNRFAIKYPLSTEG
ncbi:MAG: hypothetical protein PHS44_04490 [Candidatus Dojkabacteria bacterium]|jgi:hypothetical protein|nr:hypothetical protein [Candidatus Dojkabacteria bacterium]